MLRSTIMAHMDEALNESKYRFKQLQEIDNEVKWDQLVNIIEPHYQTSSIGRNLISAESMLRIYFLQRRYGMSAPKVEEALFQIEVLRDFAKIEMDSGIIPHKSCIDLFEELIKENQLANLVEIAFEFEPLIDDSVE